MAGLCVCFFYVFFADLIRACRRGFNTPSRMVFESCSRGATVQAACDFLCLPLRAWLSGPGSGFGVLRPCDWTSPDFVAKGSYGLHVSQKPQVNLLVPDEARILYPMQVLGHFQVLFVGQDLDLADVGPSRDHPLLAEPGAALFGRCSSHFGDFLALE